MLHSVADLKESVSGLLTGTNLNTVTNPDGAIERAARSLVQQADIPEASGIQPLLMYGGVYYYPAPDTLFGTAINDIRRQGDSQTSIDYSYKVPLDEFSRNKGLLPNGFMLSLEYKNGVGALGISSPIPFPQAIIDPMNDTDGWTAAGSASGLAQDITNYYNPPASLRFTITGASTGTLTKTLTNPNDWSIYEDVGVAFLAIQIPAGATASNLTSVALRLGSDSGNYNEVSATQGFLGAWIANDWLLVALDFAGASQTGTPNWAAIDYVQVQLAHAATFTNFRVGGLWMSLPTPIEVLFQSSALFLADGSSAPSQRITNDNDTILLNDAAYTLLEYETAVQIGIQDGGGAATPLVQNYQALLHGETGLYMKYRADNPSDELRSVGSYWSGGYSNGYGRSW